MKVLILALLVLLVIAQPTLNAIQVCEQQDCLGSCSPIQVENSKGSGFIIECPATPTAEWMGTSLGQVGLSVDISPSGRLSLVATNLKNSDVSMAISFPQLGCYNYAIDFGNGEWESINISRRMDVMYGAMSGVVVGSVVSHFFLNGKRKPEIIGTLAVLGGIGGYLLSSAPVTPIYFELKNVNIEIASSLQEIEKKIQPLLLSISNQKHKIIGLDTEWKPSRGSSQPPLALLQLSTEDQCILIRLTNLPRLPDCVKTLLEDDSILKAGVGIAGDAKLIWNQYEVLSQGCVDIQAIAHREDRIETSGGLAGLAKTILHISINKTHHIRCGDWEAEKLSNEQIQYGATDAWVGFKLLHTLYIESQSKDDVKKYCGSVIDSVYNNAFSSKRKNPRDIDDDAKSKAEISERLDKLPYRKTVLYENVIMQGPDGVALCSVNRKKAKWYVDRELAVFIDDPENPILQLHMQPKGKGHAGDEFYMSKKENKCVVCGNSEKNCRFSIVPHSFRKYFPMRLKSHSSHDIVLLCQKCLHRISIHCETYKKKLIKEILGSEQPNPQWEISEEIRNIVRIASGMVVHKASIPAAKYQLMEEELKAYLKKDVLSDEDILAAKKLDYKKKVDGDTPEEEIIKTIKTPEEWQKFIERFREQFLSVAKPKFMPTGWRIDHPVFVESNKYD